MSVRTVVVKTAVTIATVVVAACGGDARGGGSAGTGLAWERDLGSALRKASTERKLVMVDFYTDWCRWCRKLDETTYADAEVRRTLSSVVAVKLDAEKGGRQDAVRYRVDGYPTVLFLDATGDEVGRIPGYLPPEAFLEELRDILEKQS